MIDVLFNESFANSLKYFYQQHQIANELIVLPVHLNLGDIALGNFIENRRTLFKIQSTHDRFSTTSRKMQQLTESLKQLDEVAERGLPIRIWWSDLSEDVCGFLWLCEALADKGARVFEIHVPLSFVRGEALVTLSSLGELLYDDIERLGLTKFEKPLTRQQRKVYRYGWRDLRSDNTPVRVNINGQLVSQPINFYDQFLLSQVSSKQFRNVVRVIGETLGRYPVGAPDWWYRHRIDYLISKGVLNFQKADPHVNELDPGKIKRND
jgi:hypothetical protein